MVHYLGWVKDAGGDEVLVVPRRRIPAEAEGGSIRQAPVDYHIPAYARVLGDLLRWRREALEDDIHACEVVLGAQGGTGRQRALPGGNAWGKTVESTRELLLSCMRAVVVTRSHQVPPTQSPLPPCSDRTRLFTSSLPSEEAAASFARMSSPHALRRCRRVEPPPGTTPISLADLTALSASSYLQAKSQDAVGLAGEARFGGRAAIALSIPLRQQNQGAPKEDRYSVR